MSHTAIIYGTQNRNFFKNFIQKIKQPAIKYTFKENKNIKVTCYHATINTTKTWGSLQISLALLNELKQNRKRLFPPKFENFKSIDFLMISEGIEVPLSFV